MLSNAYLKKKNLGLILERRDNFNYLRYSDGVKIKWDSMSISIEISDSYQGKTTGLCGYYNDKFEGRLAPFLYSLVKTKII